MSIRCHTHPISGLALSVLTCLVASRVDAGDIALITNPIGRIARIFDPQLVKTEDRVSWLEDRLATFAEHREHAMKTGLGYRGCRTKVGAADPSITLDLGSEFPIETIFLVPAQREFLEDPGIFPKRFTLELSNQADFTQRTVVFTSAHGPSSSRLADGNPVPFKANYQARYVRLTVHEGHNRGTLDLFGLSEIAVISHRDPVSFEATVSTVGDLNVPGIWYPEALTDGRTPLGIWQNEARPNSVPGDSVEVSQNDETVSWTISLDQAAPLDRLVLFPYQLDRSSESSVFPDSLTVHLAGTDEKAEELAYQWAKHSVEKYGAAEVSTWLWEVWNEANNQPSGYWNGLGINSSAAKNDTTSFTALGILKNDNGSGGTIYGPAGSSLGAFDGLTTLISTDVLIKYTYYGDADLSGSIDGSDYSLIDTGFNAHTTGWTNGDFNFDGVVDGSDYSLIDTLFNTHPIALSASAAAAAIQPLTPAGMPAAIVASSPATVRVGQGSDETDKIELRVELLQ